MIALDGPRSDLTAFVAVLPERRARTATRIGLRGSWDRALFVVLAAIGAAALVGHIQTERAFYYWDYGFYENSTYELARALTGSIGQWQASIARSLYTEYNTLFAVPLLPWILLLGAHRWVFVLSIYVTYFVPYVLLVMYVARARFPAQRTLAGALACLAVAATPHAFTHILQGYPDIGGAAFMLAGVVALEIWFGSGRTRWALAAGVAIGAAIVFRRHFVYAALALYAALLIEAVLVVLGRLTPRVRPISSLRPAVFVSGVAAAGLVSGLVVASVAHGLVAQVLHAPPGRFAPWEQPIPYAMADILGTIGLVPLVCACLGWAWLIRQPGPESASLRLVFGATPCWVLLWVLHSRQTPLHYPHWTPHFVALGLTFAALGACRLVWPLARLGALGMLAAVALSAALHNPAWPASPEQLALWPNPYERLTHPDYYEVLGLTRYLRLRADRHAPIVVAASSGLLNYDLLRSADGLLASGFEDRLNIAPTPQVDTEPAPAAYLLRAEYVVVATPFQHHLRPEAQDVVRATVEPFTAGWPLADDFEPLPRTFALSDGVQVRVFHRIRTSSLETANDTARRVQNLVSGSMDAGEYDPRRGAR